MTADHRWTQTCISDLRARLQSGHSVTDIAAVMARPPESVIAMMSRLRLRQAVNLEES